MELVVCANATGQTGAGHAMRCLSLADAWRGAGYGPVSIYGEVDIAFVTRRIDATGVRRHSRLPPPVVNGVLVVDTYDLDKRAALANATEAQLRVLVDDIGEPVPASYTVVWNPNAWGTAALYPGFAGSVITGADAIALRSDLPAWRRGDGDSIGIALGGGEVPHALHLGVTLLAERLPNVSFSGAGPWVPNAFHAVDANAPWTQFSRCARLITAAGSTIWEAAAVGVPTVVVLLAANQIRNAEWAEARGVPIVNALCMKSPLDFANSVIAALPSARSLPRIVDGSAHVARQLHAHAREGPPQ